jgi:RNA recognition motif-containing protein
VASTSGSAFSRFALFVCLQNKEHRMKLHIGNLAHNITDAELNDMITAIAPPKSVEIIRDRTGASKGFGFADFESADQAQAVIAGMNGREVSGQALKLGEAKPRKTDVSNPAREQAR